MKNYFVTGTDTEVGKTYVTCQMIAALQQNGYRAVGYKPVSAGCDLIDGHWLNEDGVALHKATTLDLRIEQVNPIVFKDPIAPHIASSNESRPITVEDMVSGWHELARYTPEVMFTEGAGGWKLPLGGGHFMPELAQELNQEVIIVVGMRLGCLNHALLTAQAILADGLSIKGWIANRVTESMTEYEANLTTLDELMPAPRLAEIQYQQPLTMEQAASLSQVLV